LHFDLGNSKKGLLGYMTLSVQKRQKRPNTSGGFAAFEGSQKFETEFLELFLSKSDIMMLDMYTTYW